MNQNVTIPSPLNAGDVLTITVAGADPTITGVSISGAATVNEGATSQYAATVTGTGSFNPAVMWSVDDGAISPSGLFTAPLKVETVNIKATSVEDSTKFAVFPVSIALPSNTVKIAPSGGDDTATLQAALNSTASAGKVLEMTVGTFHLNPISVPAGTNLLIDPGVLITDQSVYGANSVMFNIVGSNVKITATGAFAQMPLNRPVSGTEFRHCVAVNQGNTILSNITIVGLSVKSAGGDCFYFRAVTNLTVSNISATNAARNGVSVTGKVNGATFNNVTSVNNADGCFDFEPNTNTDALQNIIINNLTTGGTNGGLNFGFQHLDNTTPPVSIVVNGYTSNGDGGTHGPGYPIFFDSDQDGKPPAGGSVVVNNINITNAVSAAIYGKNQGGNGFCQFAFNNITTSNTNTGGVDRYGMGAVVGVELYGGQPGPAGNAVFNPARIQAGTKSTAYFQIAKGAPNTQFNGSPSTCTGAPSGCPTKYP
ncbi:MAG TPA: hypothetical protein VN682_17070 [Terriglobales bacterium]|nr:hypothetical protein [Terriglobales bacterium]